MTDINNKNTGALALVGSGEYTVAMEETDNYLLQTVGGTAAKVVIMATAAGLEGTGSVSRWTSMGQQHFARLGVKAIPVEILSHPDAFLEDNLNLLKGADFYYFSGGNPSHLIETMQDTPAWDIISQQWQNGAVLAGCSAGAMALGINTVNIRAIASGGNSLWRDALGLLPHLVTMPHFDRIAGYVGQDTFNRILKSAPVGMTLLGVDEDTALVRIPPYNTTDTMHWQVMGRQTVSVFSADNDAKIYKSGQKLELLA